MTRVLTVNAGTLGRPIDAVADALDLVGLAWGADGVVVAEDALGEAFFRLRSGVAGEVFQKLTTYGVRTAFVVADPRRRGGDRFAELAGEHRDHRHVRIVADVDTAMSWLTGA